MYVLGIKHIIGFQQLKIKKLGHLRGKRTSRREMRILLKKVTVK